MLTCYVIKISNVLIKDEITSVEVREGSLWYLDRPHFVIIDVEETLRPSTIFKNTVGWLTQQLNNAQQLEMKQKITSK